MRNGIFPLIMALLLWFALPVAAQDSQALDYRTWDRLAGQAEQIISSNSAGEQQLNDIRAQVVDWRAQFQQGQSINGSRITSVKEQIAALGPAPAEGASEAPEVAARRKELNDQLTTLQAPGITAGEAASRADSIVRNIDQQLSEIQAIVLLDQAPSPLDPRNWTLAAKDGGRVVGEIAAQTATLGAATDWDQLRGNLPKVLGYLALAIALLTWGRRWILSLPSGLSERASEHSRAVVAFMVSLGQIAVPMLGLFLAISALDATGLLGNWTRPFLVAMPAAGVILFGGHWLSRQLFPRSAIAYDTLDMPAEPRQRAGSLTRWLAAAFAIRHVLGSALLQQSGLYEASKSQTGRIPFTISDGANSVGSFILIAITCALVFRLGNALRGIRTWAPGDDVRIRNRVVGWLGIMSRPIAVLVLVTSALGFINMANAVLWPWLMTLALIGMLILLQDLIADIFNMLKRGQEGARDGLAPLLIGLMLILLSVPLFMAIWGASRNDLAEMGGAIQQGVTVGGVRLSPGAVLMFVIVFTGGYFLTRVVQGAVRNSILPRTKLDAGAQNAAVSGLGYIGIFLAALLAITSAGINLSSLAIVAGALSVGIGFGMQNIVSNFVSGIILLVERPVAVGDWIQVGTAQGYVKRISVRSTQIQTFDRTDVIVPNSDLISKEVTNWTRGNQQGRIIVPVGVAYGSDTRKVAAILKEIAEDQPIVLINPPPTIAFVGFGADSLNFEVRAILSDINQGLGVQTEMRHQIIERFAREGIDIPFAHREVRIVNADQLAGPLPGLAPAKPPEGEAQHTPAPAPEAEANLSDPQDSRIARASSSGLEDAAGGSDGDGGRS